MSRTMMIDREKLELLWEAEVSLKNIAILLSTPENPVSERQVKNARFQYSLPRRKGWSPVNRIGKPDRMKRRCIHCSAHYETGKDWEPHEGCHGRGGFSIYVEEAA